MFVITLAITATLACQPLPTAPAAICWASCSLQNLVSARYHALASTVKPAQASALKLRRVARYFLDDVLGITANAWCVASVNLALSLRSSVLAALASWLVLALAVAAHTQWAPPPGQLAGETWPYVPRIGLAMSASILAVCLMIAAAGLNVFMNGAAEAGAERLPWAEADDDGRSFGGLDSRLVRAHVRMTLAYLLTGLAQNFGPRRFGLDGTLSHLFLAWANSEMLVLVNAAELNRTSSARAWPEIMS
mmetsp:Transcript_59704/g.135097  ORF Transcript_59704/g.135097 Transcript_59704/m.135097 type:complete len:249 (-) Transcript_59704:264-1010(-)